MGERVNTDLIDAIHHARELQIKALLEEVALNMERRRELAVDGIHAMSTITLSEPVPLADFARDNPVRYSELVNCACKELKLSAAEIFVLDMLNALSVSIIKKMDHSEKHKINVDAAILFVKGGKVPKEVLEQLPLICRQATENGIQDVIQLLCSKPMFKMAKSFAQKHGLPLVELPDGTSEIRMNTVIPFIELALSYKVDSEMPDCLVYVHPPNC